MVSYFGKGWGGVGGGGVESKVKTDRMEVVAIGSWEYVAHLHQFFPQKWIQLEKER